MKQTYGIGSVGGIAGNISNTIIQNCYNVGEINGEKNCYNAGGIAGLLQNRTQILSCYNIGDVHSFYLVGGIVGYTNGEGNLVNNCYNKGNVTVNTEGVGGLIGQDDLGDEIKNSYNIGKVTGSKSDGGVIGIHKGFQSNLFFINTAGPVFGCGNNITDPPNLLEEGNGSTIQTLKQLTNRFNNEQSETPWKDDTQNINDGYPILSWQ